MTKNFFVKLTLIFLVFITVACSGLNFSQLAPEAMDFHPRRIVLFPIEVWNHKEYDSRAVVEQVVTGSLIGKKMFTNVTDVETLQKKVLAKEELKKTMDEYLSKLRQLAFSDPDLSRKIGEMIEVDAFLFLSVDEWKYTAQGDTKMAQVKLSMEMYDAVTGKLMWKAGHAVTKDFVLIKPELIDVARNVVDKMANDMPH